MHFTGSTRTHTESGAVDGSLCLKPARFASGDCNIHWPDPSRCRPLRIAPGQTIRSAQIRNWMLKSDSGRMHRPHKAMPGYHSVACPTENRRAKPFWNKPRPTRGTGPAWIGDQIGNQTLASESVHETTSNDDFSTRQHTHKTAEPSQSPYTTRPHGRPTPTRRTDQIGNQPAKPDTVQQPHPTQTNRQHHNQPGSPEPSQSPYTTRPHGRPTPTRRTDQIRNQT